MRLILFPVMAACVTIVLALGCSHRRADSPVKTRPYSRGGPKPPSLLDVQALPEKYRDPAKEVAALLIKEGDDPKEFYCEVDPEEINAEAGKNVLIFHLWHESAFLPERRGMVGDPSIGGKCRDVWYDLEKQKVTATWGWQ